VENRKAGSTLPWEEFRKMLPEKIQGDEEVVRRIWEEVDYLPWLFIWHVLVSF